MNLNQITIKSSDVNRSVEFYLKLGLKLIVDSSPRYVRFECPVGDSTFSVSHAENVKVTSTVIYFESDNLNQIYEHLTAQGIQFRSKPQNKEWLWREASLKDPDGHMLILYSAGNYRKYPPWRISVSGADQ